MEMIGRIRRMHAQGKKSEREISQVTGLSRNTVAKWRREPVDGAPKYKRVWRASKLTPYHEVEPHRLLRRPQLDGIALHGCSHGRRVAGVTGVVTIPTFPSLAEVFEQIKNEICRIASQQVHQAVGARTSGNASGVSRWAAVKSMWVRNERTEEQRWSYMRRWAVEHLQTPNVSDEWHPKLTPCACWASPVCTQTG
jgi:hypothetical protein